MPSGLACAPSSLPVLSQFSQGQEDVATRVLTFHLCLETVWLRGRVEGGLVCVCALDVDTQLPDHVT